MYNQCPTDSNKEELRSRASDYQKTLDMEETFWRQKASCSWILNGDKNTKIFHNMVNRKRIKGKVHQIVEGDRVITDSVQIHESAVNYFTKVFTDELPISEEPDLIIIEDFVDEEINVELCEPPGLDELQRVVFSLNKDSSAGPDGFPAIFYSSCWDIIKTDLLEAVVDYFHCSSLPVGISATSLALIPKVENPTGWSDYRPISLYNCSHKIITRLLNERLSTVLPALIFVNHSGFLKGRLTSNNILLTQELIHSLDVKTRGANLALKIDMSKAYDRLSWKFLCSVLSAFGFSDRWIGLVMRSVDNCHFGVLLNGVSQGFIKPLHGLR